MADFFKKIFANFEYLARIAGFSATYKAIYFFLSQIYSYFGFWIKKSYINYKKLGKIFKLILNPKTWYYI